MKVYYAGQKAIELVFRYINQRLEGIPETFTHEIESHPNRPGIC